MSAFFCRECGAESQKWFGRCPSCNAWNSIVEVPSETRVKSKGRRAQAGARGFSGAVAVESPRPLGDRESGPAERLVIGLSEADRALGGGIVRGSVVLLGGDPGVGKSTLALEIAGLVATKGCKCLYVTGEESRGQVQLRAQRLGVDSAKVLLAAESDVARIVAWMHEHEPDLVIVDSIQTIFDSEVEGAPGSVTQVRESAFRLHTAAKARGTAVLLIGHVTKEGALAGPRLLEHMVDTVLYLEGERIGSYRVLRAVKNRFGSTDEIGLFEMREAGLCEVADPSRMLLDLDTIRGAGAVVVPTIEGTRPLLLEVQALVTSSAFGTAQRVANGIDPRRLSVLLAVLQKHGGADASGADVFINVVSGIRITEPAADLAVLLAVVSSMLNEPLPKGLAVLGEVGLGGELRPVHQCERRVSEAIRVGFERVILPASATKDLTPRTAPHAVPSRTVADALARAGLEVRPRRPRS